MPDKTPGEERKTKARPRCSLCGRFLRRRFPGTDIELVCPKAFWDSYAGAWEHD